MDAIGEWNWALAITTARYNSLVVKDIFAGWSSVGVDPHPPIHEIIFCATNLAFATELYLKAACVACGERSPPKKHELLTIFNNIPKTDREEILSLYESTFEPKYSGLRSGEIWLRLGDNNLPSDNRPASLLDVLGHYSASYEDWRYIFAMGKKANPSNLRALHYSRLIGLCEAIDHFMQIRFPKIVRKNEISIY
ncbi:hypothetical protein [Sulfitobacter donghicola]|uniref:HEPN domain-containing protein n=1 Tax=Sulfitobacter donghicola DSW-25 = KCTC 12864 = JCM 14565 TaxID=1300350 RepID=A0A073IEU9_9RHOB|nr:hypothetical protein [Sulfitobacter donghicola]KEJ88893.1 hypothetical protein DSW25_14540 [Sulfitobacter donghicola DSW-25 = KCTC 12864 = JCM 14565]KIN68657.1 hypothetical protein Z948_2388 [Sulfitobacter donghicola DSW-25 = KCTC 12864 = JCM 14565]